MCYRACIVRYIDELIRVTECVMSSSFVLV